MLVIAHRGASGELPENTLPAFELAIEQGADFVEFDVHADRDGQLVVVHESPAHGHSYPSLESVLDLCRGRIGVMVELKRPGATAATTSSSAPSGSSTTTPWC